MSSNEKRQSMMGGEVRDEIDERAVFEKFMSKRGWAAVYAGDGLYEMPSVQQQWEVWQGRAAIAAPQEQAERAGVPEKVARMLESAFFGQANWLRVREVTAAIRALAAPAPQEGIDCDNCHKCLDGKTTDAGLPIALTRMILCPNCGNKRCPKASDHTLACTNSNEPGQVGSVYGIATPATAAAANGDGAGMSNSPNDDENPYYGQDCPKGMVQVEFVGCSPRNRLNEYGWKPCKSTFLEIYIDGHRFRIEVGNFHDGVAERRGLHIVTGKELRAEVTSVNAASIFLLDKDKAPAADADGQKPYQVTIGGDGFFAGCKVTIDPALPPDMVEMRGANRVRLNIKTGEIAVAPTHQPAPQTSGKEGETA